MTEYREGELVFRFPKSAIRVLKFDDPKTHQASVMKAVDFIVELPDYNVFVEVKDPDKSVVTQKSRDKFEKKLKSGELENNLVYKYRDSFIYRYCENKWNKPAWYVVLLEMKSLQPPVYQLWADKLKRRLPLVGPQSWSQTIVDEVMVVNISTWNKLGFLGEVSRS